MTFTTDDRAVQLPLFAEADITVADQDAVSIKANGSSFHDPAFASNKTLPVHRWVPWIAGFSSMFVQGAMSRYLNNYGTVLDPFSGVGTTLVEAVLQGHNAIGFEINPYAALACRAKLNAAFVDLGILQRLVNKFHMFYCDKIQSDYTPKHTEPQGFKTRSTFYHPLVLRKVLIFWDFVDAMPDSDVKDLFRLAFASTMITYSNYSYEPSLGRRVSAGKAEINDFPVGETILHKLREIIADISWCQVQLSGRRPSTRVIKDSFFNFTTSLESASVDLIITSPPYLNNYHYNRNTRPQLYWLGLVKCPGDMKPLEHSNFGKYWQTVRGSEAIELEFELPGSDIAERLQVLRSLRPEKKVYGGNGWANYAVSYFNDCYRFVQGIQYVLVPGGTALVVIGNSILQGMLIPTDRYFAEIAESVGLELVQIDVPRSTRVGNSIIQSDVRVTKAKASHKLYEAVVELRKC
ncbi:MAG: site-specific DNA-methyltransferase [Anaerolineae bacterium]|nr:site-specific DNA-methyltransferase [Anaerolineae bacterium]